MVFFISILLFVIVAMLQLEEVLLIVRKIKYLNLYLYIHLVLNEINQHAHRLDEKPAHFKLADICQPVCIE
jgi:hypothetical protein